MKTWTVIGYYPDNMQRWMEQYQASCAAGAEILAPEEVNVVAVIAGEHDCADFYASGDNQVGPERVSAQRAASQASGHAKAS